MAEKDLSSFAGLESAPQKRAAVLGSSQGTELKLIFPFGIAALAFAIASMLMCFGFPFAEFVFGLEPYSLDFNPHVQAVIMWGLAFGAVYALWRDRKRHHSVFPLALGAFAAAVLITTIYVRYFVEIEIMSYALLVVAAFMNQNVFLGVLNRTVREQAREIDVLNQGLKREVENQVHEIDRLARLKQFLSPQVADLVVTEGQDKLLDTHRRYIACLFCDIRDFTAVSEDIEPEEVIAILHVYHEQIGGLVIQHHGTIGYRAGDGLMVFFNDPIPCREPVLDAVKLALDIRAAFEELRAPWSRRGNASGLGIGIASGYATLGLVGFRGRADYTAIGGVVNIASRLCDKAETGQILITHRAYLDVEPSVRAPSLGVFELKGVRNPLEVYNVLALSDVAV